MRTTIANARISPESDVAPIQNLGATIHKALVDQPAALDNLAELLRQLIGHPALAGHVSGPYPARALRAKEVYATTGDGRSHFYARMNSKSPCYDPTFPRPFYVGISPRWWQHEILAWLQAQATTPNGKR